MHKWILGTILSLTLAAGLPLAAGAEGEGPRFLDRELLADTLTLDEQEELPGAQEELAAAEMELNEAIQARDDAAARVGALETDLMTAETALTTAETAALADPTDPALQAAVDAAMAEIARIEGELEAARKDLLDKQAAVGDKQQIFDEKADAVQAIEDEIAATGELVEQLSDRQVQAFNNALHSSLVRGLLPYELDSDLLQRALDEGFGTGTIHHLVTAFRQEAQFERLALRFEDKALVVGDGKFAQKAESARDRGASQFDKFMTKVDTASARAARQAARQAIAEERRSHARGKAKGHDR